MMDQEQVTASRDGQAVEAPPPSGAASAASPVKAPRLPAENPERVRFFKVYTLSEEAQRFIRDRLEHFGSVPQIRRELQQLFGVGITHGSLARYAAWYRKGMGGRRKIRDNVLVVIEALREKGHELSLQVQAKLLEVVMQASKENKLDELGPYAVSKLALAFADSERKERVLELREEMDRHKRKLDDGRLQLDRKKVEQAIPKDPGKKVDPESAADALCDLFGLDDENEKQLIHETPTRDEDFAASDNSTIANTPDETDEARMGGKSLMKQQMNKSADCTDFMDLPCTSASRGFKPTRKSVESVKSVDKQRKKAAAPKLRGTALPEDRSSVKSAKSVEQTIPRVPLYPYQRRWVKDGSRFKLWVKSVQIGASYAQCFEAVLDCARSQRKNNLWILLSASERQALELARTAKSICLAGDIAADLRENEFFERSSISQHRIEFPNGARILALPANPDTARGYAGHVVLDEFAIHRDAREIWRAAFGRASRGYKIRVISSPKGQQGKFFELAKELGLTSGVAPSVQPVGGKASGFRLQTSGKTPEARSLKPKASVWSGHWTDIHTAVREGCPLNTEELRAAVGDEETWLQEYCCIFLGTSQAFIPLELIASCESPEATRDFEVPGSRFQVPSFKNGEPKPGTWNLELGTFFFGFDVGRKHDLAVLVVVEKLGDVLRVRKLLELAQAPFAAQKQAVRDAAQYCLRGCLDATGLGAQMAEELAAEFPGRVEPVQFTLPVKQDLAVRARRLFEERRIRIPDHAALRHDIGAVKRLITPAGNVRFDAERTDAGHADRFWALALALAAADSGLPAASLGADPVPAGLLGTARLRGVGGRNGAYPSVEFGMRNAEFITDFGLWPAESGVGRSFFQANA